MFDNTGCRPGQSLLFLNYMILNYMNLNYMNLFNKNYSNFLLPRSRPKLFKITRVPGGL